MGCYSPSYHTVLDILIMYWKTIFGLLYEEVCERNRGFGLEFLVVGMPFLQLIFRERTHLRSLPQQRTNILTSIANDGASHHC